MPQLEFANFASQIFWLIVSFSVLYLIMARSALPTIREVLQNRQTRISEDLKKAEKLKAEAETAEADFTSLVTEARQKASELIAQAKSDSDRESADRHANLDENFARQEKDGQNRIKIIEKEAIEAMTPVAVDVASDMVKVLINLDADKKEIEKLVADKFVTN